MREDMLGLALIFLCMFMSISKDLVEVIKIHQEESNCYVDTDGSIKEMIK